ncbi:hypothetical protein G9A89_008466 [Geosiphon pyriformis]|nr:hypothetical protein G9A89_008466 [Geosiphon pyriformis]
MVNNAWKCEKEMLFLSSDMERPHLPSDSEFSICKGKLPNFVWSSDCKLIVDNVWKCEEKISFLSSDSNFFNTILFTGLLSGDQLAEVQVERSHLPSSSELSTCKDKSSSFVWFLNRD